MKKPNIYLTGMMGAGKTTIGKLLAKKLRYQFVDTDALIVQKTQISINEIFAKYGEAYFRNLETKILSKLKKAKGLVVATGGGIILKDVNIKMMQASGQIFYLQRTCANIIKTLDSSKRPLLKNGKTKLFKIFATRKLCYLNTANYIMDNNCFDPSVTVKNIYLIIQQQEKFKIGYQGTIGAYG
jgi:shikimate kinase